MVNNSTNINKTNKHISSQIIKHKKNHDIWHWKSRSYLEQAQKCGRIKPFNGIPTLPILIGAIVAMIVW